jgi:hypothetical protein
LEISAVLLLLNCRIYTQISIGFGYNFEKLGSRSVLGICFQSLALLRLP